MSKDKFVFCSGKTIDTACDWAERNPENPVAKALESAIQYYGAVIEAGEDEPYHNNNYFKADATYETFLYRLEVETAACKARDIVIRAAIREMKKEKNSG